jgi:hypothetical protein
MSRRAPTRTPKRPRAEGRVIDWDNLFEAAQAPSHTLPVSRDGTVRVDWDDVIKATKRDKRKQPRLIHNVDEGLHFLAWVLARAQRELGDDKIFRIPNDVVEEVVDTERYEFDDFGYWIATVQELVRHHYLIEIKRGGKTFFCFRDWPPHRAVCPCIGPTQYREYLDRPDFPPDVLGLVDSILGSIAVMYKDVDDLAAILADALDDSGHGRLAPHFRLKRKSHAGFGFDREGCLMLHLIRGRFRDGLAVSVYTGQEWFRLTVRGFQTLAKAHHVMPLTEKSHIREFYDAREVLALWERWQEDPRLLDPVSHLRLGLPRKVKAD